MEVVTQHALPTDKLQKHRQYFGTNTHCFPRQTMTQSDEKFFFKCLRDFD